MGRRTFATVFHLHPAPTALTVGQIAATEKKTIPFPVSMLAATPLATATSMITALGMKFPNMATFGIQLSSTLAGLRTATAIGVTLVPGAGLGLTTRLGVMRHFTMDVGTTLAADGAGARDPIMRVRIGG